MNKQILLNKISEVTEINPLKIRNVYIFGSRVYGCNTDTSDIDICVVGTHLLAHQEWKIPSVDIEGFGNVALNIHMYTNDSFKEMVYNKNIMAIECLMASEEFKIKEDIKFELDISDRKKLAAAILESSCGAWGRAKYKMAQGEIKKGLKNAYHAIRIMEFGLQLVKHGKIVNFAKANKWKKKIVDSDALRWRDLKDLCIAHKLRLQELLISF